MSEKSKAYRLGQEMAKAAQSMMMPAGMAMPMVSQGGAASPGGTGDGSSMANRPNPQPTMMTGSPAPTPPSTPPPVTASPTQPGAKTPPPAVTASPATGPATRPPVPTKPSIQGMAGMLKRQSAYDLGQAMAKEAVDKKTQRIFKKIATLLIKRAGLNASEADGMEKQAFPIAALLAGLAGTGAIGYLTHRYGEPRGWWDSPEMKAAKDRLKAIRLARTQGTDPVQMGLLAPKEKEEKPWEQKQGPNYGAWGSGYSGTSKMPKQLPKGYMGQEKRIQNLASSLGLGLRHARAFSQLSRMPVF